MNSRVNSYFNAVIGGRYVVFVHHIERLQEILDYVNRNETSREIVLIHCDDDNFSKNENREYFAKLEKTLVLIQEAGFYSHLRFVTEKVEEVFSPQVIDKISKKYKVANNRVLIGSIHHEHEYDYDDLGGARIIF